MLFVENQTIKTFHKTLIFIILRKIYVMKRLATFFIFFLIINGILKGQVSFEIPDTVCAGEYFTIENTSTTNGDFFWSFCGGDLRQLPEISSFQIDFFERPVFMDIQKEEDNYFGFVTDVDGGLARLDFGTSLSNDPTIVDLNSIGNIFFGMEGIQIVKDESQWWGFIVGGTGNERLIRLDFGDSLENIPTTTDLGNFADFTFPNELQIEQNGLDWYGLTLNRWQGGSVSVFSFDNGLSEPPTGLNIGNEGNLNAPTGFHLIQDGFDYFLFIINEGNGTLSRIDFGGAFGNFPVGSNLGNLNLLESPRDVIVFEQCDEYYGYVLDPLSSRLIWLDFNGDLSSTPDASILFENEDWEFPHSFSSLIREDGNLFVFVVNVGGKKISRLQFPECTKASIPFYLGFQPTQISYSEEGTYLIQLITNEGEFDQSSFCKEIVVLPAPDLNLGQDTTLCLGETLVLNTNNSATIWQNQEISSTFEILENGIYTAQINGEECNRYDTIAVDFKNCEDCLIFPNVFTPDNDGVNDTFSPVLDCEIVFENYFLQIYNRWGQKVFTSSDQNTGWDGTQQNKSSPSDVYVWYASFIFYVNEIEHRQTLKGDVTLVR